MSRIQMAEMRQTGKKEEGNRQPQFKDQRPKIETIHEIDKRSVRDSVVEAFRRYLMSAEYHSPDEKGNKGWLDCIADTFGIWDTVRAAENTSYKAWANMGIGALMNIDDSIHSHEGIYLSRLAKSSERVDACLRGRVLDFGCSVGWLVMALKSRFNSEVIGIDIDRNALELGRFFGASGLLHMEKDTAKTPFHKDSFDAVILRHVIDAYDTGGWSNEMIFTEMSRLIRDGGVLLVSETDLHGIKAALGPYGFALIGKDICWTAWKNTKNVKTRS
jgi:2-polyprenyl-3-methyl-5-hydroxy-6-metoxy-1,4-benzoquinol methylase